ncbi:hypothetical protein Hanom_Chr03g00205271 [Helianthus anomalus]
MASLLAYNLTVGPIPPNYNLYFMELATILGPTFTFNLKYTPSHSIYNPGGVSQ